MFAKENNFILAYLISRESNNQETFTYFISWGSSFIAYLLNITFINPIEYNIPFESFMYTSYIDNGYEIDASYDFINSESFIYDLLRDNNIEYTSIYNPIDDEKYKSDNKYMRLVFNKSEKVNVLTDFKRYSKINFSDIDVNDKAIYKFINSIDFYMFNGSKTLKLLKIIKPNNLETMLKVTGIQSCEVDSYLEIMNKWNLESIPTTREDIYNYLIDKGVSKRVALDIAIISRYKLNKDKNKWEKYKTILKQNDISNDYINFIERHIDFLWSKAVRLERTIMALWIIWFKIYNAKIYNQIEKKQIIGLL